MTRDTEEAAYEVGRGKPPVQTRFKPGQSGNPRGRPRGSVDWRQALIAAASEVVIIIENGRRVRLSKHEVAARQLVNKAASGDHRATELLCKYLGNTGAPEGVAAPPGGKPDPHLGSENDAQVLEVFLQRAKGESSS